MNNPPPSLDRTIDAAAAGIFWRAAKNWLTVWKGAGFVPRLGDDGKLLFTASWVAAFPDGPATVNLLREYMVALIRDGNAAVEDDHRLRHRPERLYANYLETNDAALARLELEARRALQGKRLAEMEAEEQAKEVGRLKELLAKVSGERDANRRRAVELEARLSNRHRVA